MKRPAFYQAIKIIVAIPCVVVGFVLIFSGILLKAAGYVCLLDMAAAKYEIDRIK